MQKLDLKNAKPDKSKLVKNLAKGNILVPFLDRAFQTFDGPFTFEYSAKGHDDAWHPSGDCTPSVHSLWLKAKGMSEPWHITGQLRKSFMVGHYWHQLLQHLVVEVLEMAPADAVEASAAKGWGKKVRHYYGGSGDGVELWRPYRWVHGSADIAPFEKGNWKGLIDFKTMSSQQFKQAQVPEWAANKYLCQMNIYMDLFDLDNALIIGINKDAPHDFKEIEYKRDQPLIDAIYAKWHYVGELLDADTEPTSEDNEAFRLPCEKESE
jgi:hypothetical protein